MSTLSFDKDVITIGRWYAEKNNISLSRLVGFLLHKVITKDKCNFYFSEIEVLNGEEFFEQYIVRSA